MPRRSGANGIILLDVTSTASGTLTTAQFIGTWTIDTSRGSTEMTSMGDTSKVYVVGLPDQQIQFSGHSNLGVTMMGYLTDGAARGCTVIPDSTNNPSVKFQSGTFYWSGSITASVDGGVDFSVTGVPATSGAWTTGI